MSLAAVKDLAAGVALLAFSTIYWIGATNISISRLSGGAGANALPEGLALALAVMSIALIIRSVLRLFVARFRTSAQAAVGRENLRVPKRALVLLLIGIAYVLVLATIGYLGSIVLLLATTAYVAGWRRWPSLIAFAVSGSLLLWLLFAVVLDVRVPSGILLHAWRHFPL
jgi:putative tricarboxylic transport membrane protein